MARVPDPDDLIESLNGSFYGLLGKARPVKKRDCTKTKGRVIKMPDPDSELESLADFQSTTSNYKRQHPFYHSGVST